MEGLYVASIVPYDDHGHINDAKIRELAERQLEQGAAGFFVGGSSADCFLLSEAERIHLFEVFSEFVDRCVLFAHVGSCATAESVRYAKAAIHLGYQRIAATPPIYFGYSTREVASYYDDIAAAVGHGVYYYNIPMNTHRMLDLHDADTRTMFAGGAIEGVKHTSLDLYEMERLRSINPDLKLFGGFENEMIAFMAMGCDGLIGSTFNVMLSHYQRIRTAFETGDFVYARILQSKANAIMEEFMHEGLFPSIRHILNVRGDGVGQVRAPFLPLGRESGRRVERVVEKNMVA